MYASPTDTLEGKLCCCADKTELAIWLAALECGCSTGEELRGLSIAKTREGTESLEYPGGAGSVE